MTKQAIRRFQLQLPMATAFAASSYLAVISALGGVLWHNRNELARFFDIEAAGPVEPPLYLGLGCIGLGLLLGVLLASEVGWWRSSSAWRATTARVTNGPLPGDLHDPEAAISIAYSFEVDGQTYTGKRIGFGGFSPWERAQVLEAYQPGAIVNVFYDPRDPFRCCLRRRFSNLWLWLLVSLMFSVIGEILLVLLWI